MDYVMQFMFYVIVGISILIPTAGIIAWSMDEKRSNFKDWTKTF